MASIVINSVHYNALSWTVRQLSNYFESNYYLSAGFTTNYFVNGAVFNPSNFTVKFRV